MEFDRWLDTLPAAKKNLAEINSATTNNRKLIKEHSIFSDVTILCDDQSIPCHRVILAEYSPVLHTMLTSDFNQGQSSDVTGIHTIEIKEINPCVLKQIVDFLYIRFIDITKDNVLDIVKFSDMYEVLPLKMLLAGYFMENLIPEVSWMLWRLSSTYRLKCLEQGVIQRILAQFNLKWLTYEGFFELEEEKMVRIFSHPHLHIAYEWYAFAPLLQWVIYDQESRGQVFSKMLSQCIRLRNVDLSEIVTIISSLGAPLIPEVSKALLSFQEQVNGNLGISKVLPYRRISGQVLFIAVITRYNCISLHVRQENSLIINLNIDNSHNLAIVACVNTKLYLGQIQSGYMSDSAIKRPNVDSINKKFDLQNESLGDTLMKGAKWLFLSGNEYWLVTGSGTEHYVQRLIGEDLITVGKLTFLISLQTYIYSFQRIIYFLEASREEYYAFDISHISVRSYKSAELGDIPDKAKLITCSHMASFVSDECIHVVYMDHLLKYHQDQTVAKWTCQNAEDAGVTESVQSAELAQSLNDNNDDVDTSDDNDTDDESGTPAKIRKLETADEEECVIFKRFNGPVTGKEVIDATVLGETLWVLYEYSKDMCKFACANMNNFLQPKDRGLIIWHLQKIQLNTTRQQFEYVQIGIVTLPECKKQKQIGFSFGANLPGAIRPYPLC